MMVDWIINLLALVGTGLIVTGVALVSVPAALVVAGGALLALAFAIVRVDEHRKRTAQE
jgi:hypothetical protein